jgi:transcriptional regulator with XRE-family HTH domain
MMVHSTQSPAQLRNMFGSNLRILSAGYASISDLARQLGINRTQFNRYLSGESFPRPDVLSRMCTFFGVDARVLLQPVGEIGSTQDPISNPFLRDFVGVGARDVPNDVFPGGFYRFSRRSFIANDRCIVGLVHIRRDGSNTFLRGFESKKAMKSQYLPTEFALREFRGIVMQQEDGIAIIVTRKGSMTCSFNYLSRVASFDNNFWLGYVTRTVPDSMGGLRATRLVYEYIGNKMVDVLPAARAAGFCKIEDLLPYHQKLLRPEETFA